MDTVGVTSNVRLSNEEKALADKLSAFAYGEYCGDRPSSMELTAALTVRGRFHWIVNDHAEDGYQYGLFDPQQNEQIQLQGAW
jgi:hypothetical protein